MGFVGSLTQRGWCLKAVLCCSKMWVQTRETRELTYAHVQTCGAPCVWCTDNVLTSLVLPWYANVCVRRVLVVTVESDVVSVQLSDGKPLSPQLVDEQVKQCMKELVRSCSREVSVVSVVWQCAVGVVTC